MNIRFNQDGSVDNIAVNQFVNQLSSGQKIGVLVTGLAADEFTARAYGVLPNGDSTIISCVPVDGSTYWEITLNTANTAYAGKLTITVQIILNQTNYVFTYPLYLTVNPTIPGNVEFPITLDEVTTFLSQLQNYPTKIQADARFQQKFSLNTMRVYNTVEDLTSDFSNLVTGQLYAVRNDTQVSLYYKNQIGSTVECFVTLAGKAEQDAEGNVIHEIYATKESVENLQAYLEGGTIIVEEARYASYDTLTGQRIASVPYVDEKVGTMSSHYVTSDAAGNSFATRSALLAGPYYYAGQLHDPDQNDYAFVEADEEHEGKAARYVYQGEQWNFQYVIPTPVSGVVDVKVNGTSVLNAQKVANIDLLGKLDKVTLVDDTDRLYGITKTGNQAIYKVGDGLLSNLVVRRNADAQVLVPSVPTNEYHATSKSYVDSHSIKEINTEYIRIWDLDVGIYKLTYNGTKYLYYYGATGTQTRSLNTGTSLLYIVNNSDAKYWYAIYAGPYGGCYYGKTTATTGEFTQTYNFSPIYKVNKSTLVPDIFAPITKGENGQVLTTDGGNTPTWDYLKPYTMIYTIDLASSNTITVEIRNDFPMFNGREDILVEIMPQDMLDEWVENNVTFEESHPGYFHSIIFTADAPLSAPVKVLVKAQVKGTV